MIIIRSNSRSTCSSIFLTMVDAILKSLSGSGAFKCPTWRSDISAAVFFAKECYWILAVRIRMEFWRVLGENAGTAGFGYAV